MEPVINFIIRPPRADYCPANDLLDREFMLKGEWFQRKDLEVLNSRGNVLQCSHYMPLKIPEGMALPCVIYCHGNSGCRADASEAAIILLPSYITVFTLDFSGSGLSEGEHVTLGMNEKDDLRAVVNHLRADGNVSCIGLWGRSMGAVTSIMYGVEDPSIAGMVLDSPFSNLVDLMMELVDTYKVRIPKFTVKFAIQYMRKAIQRKAKFDIMDLNAIQIGFTGEDDGNTVLAAKCCFVPALLGYAADDDFIRPHHSDRIYESYAGDKNIIKFEGDHNSPRPQFYFDSITIFFHNVLHPPKDVLAGNIHDISGKGGWNTVHEIGDPGLSLEPHFLKELRTSSREDAISELRSRRPMSRTEVPGVSPVQEILSGSEENENDNGLGSSSSRLISGDQSNYPCYNAPYPTETDEHFLEHSFDGLAYFPFNLEDENRMIMEAVLESLKDLETNYAPEHPPSGVGPMSHTLRLGDPLASTVEHTALTEMVDNSTSARNECELPQEPSSPNLGMSSASPTASSVQYNGSPTVQSSTSSEMSATIQGSSDSDMLTQNSHMASGVQTNTTAERNPSRHIMNGLVHRWGLNFFGNS